MKQENSSGTKDLGLLTSFDTVLKKMIMGFLSSICLKRFEIWCCAGTVIPPLDRAIQNQINIGYHHTDHPNLD